MVNRFPQIKEYQVLFENHDSMLEAKLLVECEKNIAEELEHSLQDSFSLRIPVEVVDLGSLPRNEMKANRWIRNDRT